MICKSKEKIADCSVLNNTFSLTPYFLFKVLQNMETQRRNYVKCAWVEYGCIELPYDKHIRFAIMFQLDILLLNLTL